MNRLHLFNEALSLEILPVVGGKIASLFDKANGQEWLWTNPWLSLRDPAYGESYVGELDFGGWDEIFPSVDPCRISTPNGEALVPDHGDAFACHMVCDTFRFSDAVQRISPKLLCVR